MAEQIVDVPTPQILEEIVEERISERIAEQIVDVPTPQILEEIVEVVSVPQERILERIAEQIIDVTTVHRQFCERPCEHAATSPSASNCCEEHQETTEAAVCAKSCESDRGSPRHVPRPLLLFIISISWRLHQ